MAKLYVNEDLYVDDEQLMKRLNFPQGNADFLVSYEDKKNFPRREAAFANKRYWPAVVAWFDFQFGLAERGPSFVAEDVEPYLLYPSKKKRRKSRWGE
jgi:hypothetical protein